MKLTPKQEKFANSYIESGNATSSARQAYNTSNDASARAIGSENLTKLNIQTYLGEKAYPVLENMLYLALNAEKESDQIRAGKEILDRAFKINEKEKAPNETLFDEESKKKMDLLLEEVFVDFT
jgi:phage terminase small subunit